jgi:membrane protein DedA with SNARE-associated domain
LDDQSRIFFYFEVFDGQNWIFLKSEYGHAFSSVYETSLFDSIFFYLILVIIVVVILFLVLIILKRKNMKGKGVDPEKKY